MRFEDLQKIWDTQNDRPVFSMDDARLTVALYQQREHSRRRLFWRQYVPQYVAALGALAGAAFIFYAFLWKSIYIQKIARDFPMSAWDYVAFVVAAACFLAMAAIMYAERKQHERTQNVFAPSLREELDRGISQLDFELSLYSASRLFKLNSLLAIGALLLCWETGRLNGEPAPWNVVWVMLSATVLSHLVSLPLHKKMVNKRLPRRRALESMRAALED